jgi:hypothetical protein
MGVVHQQHEPAACCLLNQGCRCLSEQFGSIVDATR